MRIKTEINYNLQVGQTKMIDGEEWTVCSRQELGKITLSPTSELSFKSVDLNPILLTTSNVITTSNVNYFCNGIQLRPRRFVPKRLGDFILWLFFHRTDTQTQVTLSGFAGGK